MRLHLDKRPDSRPPTVLHWNTPFEGVTLYAIRSVAGHTLGGVNSERCLIPIVGGVLDILLSMVAGLYHETTEASALSICCHGAVPGHQLGPNEDAELNSGRRYVFFGAFPPEDKRNVIAGRGKPESNTVIRFNPDAMRDSRIRWYVSQNGIILAADPVDELYIDYVYKRLDAKKAGAGSGETLRPLLTGFRR